MPPLLDANASSHEMHATENANISALLRELPFFTTGIPSVRKDPPRPIGQLVYCQASTAPGSLEVRDCRLPRQRFRTMIITRTAFFKGEFDERLSQSALDLFEQHRASRVHIFEGGLEIARIPRVGHIARPAGPIEQEAAFFLWIILE